MILDIVPLLVLSFAAYRLTRLIVIDTLLDGSRNKLHLFLLNRAKKEGKLHLFWEKLYDLVSCTFCTGTWISLALYSLYIQDYPWFFSRFDWISVFAVAGLQSLLHTWEIDS